MTEHQNASQHFSGRVYRVVWAVSGLLLASHGIYVVFLGVVNLPLSIGAGLLITLLGANAVWSSIRSKQSWLAMLVLFI